MQIERIVSSLTGLGASWVLWLLVILSLVALAVVIERAVFFSSSRDDVEGLRVEVLKRLRAGEVKLALRRLEESPSPEASILRAGLASGLRDELEREAAGLRPKAVATGEALAPKTAAPPLATPPWERAHEKPAIDPAQDPRVKALARLDGLPIVEKLDLFC